MSKVVLRELTSDDEKAFLKATESWSSKDLDWITFVWKPGMSHQEHLKILENNKDKNKIEKHHVTSTMLYGFLENTIIGRVSIRHNLNENLRQRGGHIGYAVCPEFRGNGYAQQMYLQALNYCKTNLNMSELLVTCSNSNIPSIKVIENQNHDLIESFEDIHTQEVVNKYIVQLG